MKVLKILVKLIIGLFVFAIVGLFFISRGNAFEPGVKNNQLAPCPDRPNCVNSTMNTEDGNYLEAISYSEDLEPIHESIQQIFGPNTQIIKHSQNYMHCTYKVGIWTDDVEFLFDTEQNLIHFRSASRWGYGDRDVNKNRMNSIRKQISELN